MRPEARRRCCSPRGEEGQGGGGDEAGQENWQSPSHRDHGLPRQRQDDADEPDPEGAPRQAHRRHRERVRRGGHRRRAAGGRAPDDGGEHRGDEQRLHMLHREGRPHRRSEEDGEELREDRQAPRRRAYRDHRPRGPRARGPDLLRGRLRAEEAGPRRHPHGRGCPPHRPAPGRGEAGGRGERGGGAGCLCRPHPVEQVRPGRRCHPGGRGEADPHDQRACADPAVREERGGHELHPWHRGLLPRQGSRNGRRLPGREPGPPARRPGLVSWHPGER
mmetsp:Transcript_76265/g.227297  ORF Transcript_76265/g.227297 Transcript_76265/m.227297 type:complete len:276 (-) Transcript_76265:342-1169(-)